MNSPGRASKLAWSTASTPPSNSLTASDTLMVPRSAPTSTSGAAARAACLVRTSPPPRWSLQTVARVRAEAHRVKCDAPAGAPWARTTRHERHDQARLPHRTSDHRSPQDPGDEDGRLLGYARASLRAAVSRPAE